MDNNYKVIYRGALKDDVDAERFVKEFTQKFKTQEHYAHKRTTIGRAVTLKNKLDAATAERYRVMLDRLGMQVYVENDEVYASNSSASSDAVFPGNGEQWTYVLDDLDHARRYGKHTSSHAGLPLQDDYSEIDTPVSEDVDDLKITVAIAKVLRVFFPPLNEVTLFVIAVTLYTLFIYVDVLPSPTGFIAMFLGAMVGIAKGSVSGFFMMLIFGPVILLSLFVMIVGPLMLPFTKNELRWSCGMVVGIFAVIALISSVHEFVSDPNQLMNRVILIYTLLWPVYVFYVLKYINETGFIVSDEQADVASASVAAIVSVIFVYVASEHYSMKWYVAFVVGVTSSASIVPLVYKIVELPLKAILNKQAG